MSRNDDLYNAVVTAEQVLEEEGTDMVMTGAILLSALHTGPNIKRLETYCGVPRARVQPIAQRMRKANLWWGERMYLGHWEESDVGFVLDVLLACGEVEVAYWDKGEPYFGAVSRCNYLGIKNSALEAK